MPSTLIWQPDRFTWVKVLVIKSSASTWPLPTPKLLSNATPSQLHQRHSERKNFITRHDWSSQRLRSWDKAKYIYNYPLWIILDNHWSHYDTETWPKHCKSNNPNRIVLKTWDSETLSRSLEIFAGIIAKISACEAQMGHFAALQSLHQRLADTIKRDQTAPSTHSIPRLWRWPKGCMILCQMVRRVCLKLIHSARACQGFWCLKMIRPCIRNCSASHQIQAPLLNSWRFLTLSYSTLLNSKSFHRPIQSPSFLPWSLRFSVSVPRSSGSPCYPSRLPPSPGRKWMKMNATSCDMLWSRLKY